MTLNNKVIQVKFNSLTRYSEILPGFFAQKLQLVTFPNEIGMMTNGIHDLPFSVEVYVMKYGALLSKKFLKL